MLLQGAAAGHRVVRHGVVFGAFMTWNMLGAQLCKRLLASSGGTQPETLVGGIIVASGCALLLPVFTTEFSVRIGGFCIFEAAIGAYWPLIMKLRSDHLGEEQRAAVTSLFRVPLNGVVCLVLLRAGAPSLTSPMPLPPHPRPAGKGPSSAFARLVRRRAVAGRGVLALRLLPRRGAGLPADGVAGAAEPALAGGDEAPRAGRGALAGQADGDAAAARALGAPTSSHQLRTRRRFADAGCSQGEECQQGQAAREGQGAG